MDSLWTARVRAYTPDFLAANPALSGAAAEAAILLHGSTTFGIDDPYSDLDVWVLVPDHALAALDSAAGTRFLPFTLDGKPGHFTVEPHGEFERRVRQCDFPLIAELRLAEILADSNGRAASLVETARRPMRDAVRSAWLRYHYVEMRGAHRAADNPIERGDAVAVLQAMTQTLTEALRAAMVLHGEPYPYVKWLGRAASGTPTGRLLAPSVADLFERLTQDALRHPGPEKGHPISDTLREIRRILVEAARAGGMGEPWLDEWWFHIVQAREGIRNVEW
jgi:hypothetical protein